MSHMIDKVLQTIFRFSKSVVVFFLLMTVICMLLAGQVKVNYNLMDYLPDAAPSTVALDVMDDEYEQGPANMRLMVPEISVPEALVMKKQIMEIKGVDSVEWLDDVVSVYEPLEFADQDLVADWYRNHYALFSITVDEEDAMQTVSAIRALAGEEASLSGSAVDSALAPTQTASEIQQIMIFVLGIVLFILILTTNSWIEPVLFMLIIGIAIMLNRGTNLIFGEISFVTNSAGAILQLAVSMDYSIFLLHRFQEERTKYSDVSKAMMEAVKGSAGSILSSGLTTVTGFAALVVMRFKIGPDMGWCMAKAIIFSLLTVLICMPALILMSYRWIDKTAHKPFLPPFNRFARLAVKISKPFVILFFVLLLPSYQAQSHNDFLYGGSEIYGSLKTKMGADTAAINQNFGTANPIALLVPKGDLAKEQKLQEELSAYPGITSVISYGSMVGLEIPEEYVPMDRIKALYSEKYSRYIITLNVMEKDTGSFEKIEDLRKIAAKYYDTRYYMAGDMVNTTDLKQTVLEDTIKVNALAIGAIILILIWNFKSLTLPLILTIVIEASIWINLSIPYFTGTTLHYISYLIISSVQLGATIDYAILMTDRYMEERKVKTKEKAILKVISSSTLSIITSSGIMTCSGALLGAFSSNLIIKQLGVLVGRGAFISFLLVIFVLPALLVLFDKVIEKTSRNPSFYNEKQKSGKEEVVYES